MRMRRLLLALALLSSALAGCGGGPITVVVTSEPPSGVVTVVVTPEPPIGQAPLAATEPPPVPVTAVHVSVAVHSVRFEPAVASVSKNTCPVAQLVGADVPCEYAARLHVFVAVQACSVNPATSSVLL